MCGANGAEIFRERDDHGVRRSEWVVGLHRTRSLLRLRDTETRKLLLRGRFAASLNRLVSQCRGDSRLAGRLTRSRRQRLHGSIARHDRISGGGVSPCCVISRGYFRRIRPKPWRYLSASFRGARSSRARRCGFCLTTVACKEEARGQRPSEPCHSLFQSDNRCLIGVAWLRSRAF